VKKVFGDGAYQLPISSTKSMHGHLLGAAGALEAIITALAIENGVAPPTINWENPDEDCDLDYIPNDARELDIRVAMSNSFAFGGQNASLVLRRFEA
jgi:3-oxoacyl-(acyl-carrier-protein) synthase